MANSSISSECRLNCIATHTLSMPRGFPIRYSTHTNLMVSYSWVYVSHLNPYIWNIFLPEKKMQSCFAKHFMLLIHCFRVIDIKVVIHCTWSLFPRYASKVFWERLAIVQWLQLLTYNSTSLKLQCCSSNIYQDKSAISLNSPRTIDGAI